jgi:hypothetical protein
MFGCDVPPTGLRHDRQAGRAYNRYQRQPVAPIRVRTRIVDEK